MQGENSIAHLSGDALQLWLAVQRGQVAEARRLLPRFTKRQLGAVADGGGTSLLRLAVTTRDEEAAAALCEALLAAGAAVDARASSQETPLVVAASFGRPRIVRQLLQARANPHLVDEDMQTPLAIVRQAAASPLAALMAGGRADHAEFVRVLQEAESATRPLSRQAKAEEGCGHCHTTDAKLLRCTRCTLAWYSARNARRPHGKPTSSGATLRGSCAHSWRRRQTPASQSCTGPRLWGCWQTGQTWTCAALQSS
ncbi:hypothetical protein ABPG75_010123 [Micractinium tetrahymenae]